ncbi:hypothetical protein [Nitrososphaera viennensis]|uniref:C2H2-type domain-containing protein n=2 Tax=Nitrososphaera viennensis TaxID=1034015 RepID=A0A060HTR7_9ARCH|nr:hypothetical protein [Nitrososphaera viennensis]AIC16487.1 hypothetical protein NVIE_022270 [Nitrososphaera viennensis EN76]UVS68420.1 hypothetical protein NWT39_10980 [Nitrososphaera viennensis]
MQDNSSIPKDRDRSGIPVVCSKCNATFSSDSAYMSHYNQEHGKDIEGQQT